MKIATLLVLGLCGSAAAAGPGNAWHIPAGGEPGIASMRGPVHGITAGTDVAVYSGNQFQGTGNIGNQLQTGSAVVYKHLSDATWTTVPMTFSVQSGNNKYYVATIPGAALSSGDYIEYYLTIAYSDHPTTFVYGGDDGSQVTTDEATAQASAFAFGVEWPLQPSGASAQVTKGAWQTLIYSDSGHIGLVGASGEIDLAPGAAKLGDNWMPIGRVMRQDMIADGFALQQQMGPRVISSKLHFVGDGVLRYEVVDWGGSVPSETQIAAPSDSSEHFYGFGEKFDGLDQAGKSVHVLTSDHAGAKGDNSYKVAPWFISSRGYGFHLDTTAEAQLDMRASSPDRYVAHNYYRTLAVNLVAGPAPTDVLTRFTGYVGRPSLPPPWAFGPWISSDVWRDGGEIRYVVQKELALGIPASVFVFDSPWELAYNDFAWNTTQFAAGGTYEGQHYDGFATPADMLAFLRASGLKVVVWMTPFIDTRSNDEGIAGQNLGKASTYDTAAANGYFVRASPGGAPLVVTWWKGDGSPVDFTNPAAAAWFTGQLQQLVTASGGVIGGFKTDDGEGDYIPVTASYADGRSGVEMRNGYCVEYLKAVNSVLGADGVLLARSGFTGTQAFPGVWAGDNEPNFGTDNGLPSVVSAGMSAAMTGYAIWGSDIGGYQDVNPSSTPEDLFMRWTQFGALTPVMQMHRQVTAGKQYPWSYGQVALDNYKAYAQLHVQLFPYLYTAANEATMDGIPPIRPLPLVDANASAIGDEYLLGDTLLIAPVIAQATTTRSVYLPDGGWYDYWTHAHVTGGQTVTWTGADSTQAPIYVRDGAIVPRLPDGVQSLVDASYTSGVATPDGSLSVLVYPAANSSYTLYDGTEINCQATTSTTTIGVMSPTRALGFDVFSTAHPISVTRDGVKLTEVAPDALADDTWTYDGQLVKIRLAHVDGSTTLVLDGTSEPTTTPDPGAKTGGCGCATGGGGDVGWLLVATTIVLRRRRR
jgi:alpha-D-xyloside xylohydrolase